MKNKHLSLEDRLKIESGLVNQLSFKEIAKTINKHCTTVSREIKNHYIIKNTGGFGHYFNNCINRKSCPFLKRNKCILSNCEKFEEEICPKLSKPPYVCNGCKKRHRCCLSKKIYDANYSYSEYYDNLCSCRSGILIDIEEINNLNEILMPLIAEQKQSVHHVCINNKNKIMHSEKTIYKYIDLGILNVRNIDLPKKVRFRQRTKKTTVYKIDKKCLENRRYSDFLEYIEQHVDIPIVEMDTVEGHKGGKVLLTIHFVESSFMLAFLRKHNDAQSVIDIFNWLQEKLGLDKFKELFPIILTDNGSEFSNPLEIETDFSTGEKRTQIFYCEPGRPDQKGSCEVNHELIRRILPKGTSFDELTQNDINLMMSHINSYKRKKLNNCSPLQLFSFMYGNDTANKLGIAEIIPNKINLSDNLLKK